MKNKKSSTVTPVFLLSTKDQQVFIHAIMNPPSPNNKLLTAAKKYNIYKSKD
jgi:uncharacterized protein (DUF1778 family)